MLDLPVWLLHNSRWNWREWCGKGAGAGRPELAREDEAVAKTKRSKAELKKVVKSFDAISTETGKYWQPRSYVEMQLVCMRALGWKNVDYETLVTVSGFGTSFAYEPKDKFWAGWVAPYGCDKRVADATGFGFEWVHVESAEDAWGKIAAFISDGKPVRAPHNEELIFAGYKDAARKSSRRILAMCKPLADPPEWWTWEQFEGWFENPGHHWIGRHTRSVRKLAAKESAKNVMAGIVTLALHDPRAKNSIFDGVQWGLEGVKLFAEDIADTTKKKDYFAAGWHGCHAITPQYTGRKCAAIYLNRIAERFPGKTNVHILNAVDDYDAAYDEWLRFRKAESVRGSWGNETRRGAMADAVYRALIHEIAAVDELEAALMTQGVRVRPTRA